MNNIMIPTDGRAVITSKSVKSFIQISVSFNEFHAFYFACLDTSLCSIQYKFIRFPPPTLPTTLSSVV